MEPDRNSVGADAEDLGDLFIAQPFPSDETQQLLIVRAEPIEGRERRSRGLRRLSADAPRRLETGRKAGAAIVPATLICERPTRDRVQPRQRGVQFGRYVATAPGNGERLGGRILGIRRGQGAAEAIGEDLTVMTLEQLLIPRVIGGHVPAAKATMARHIDGETSQANAKLPDPRVLRSVI